MINIALCFLNILCGLIILFSFLNDYNYSLRIIISLIGSIFYTSTLLVLSLFTGFSLEIIYFSSFLLLAGLAYNSWGKTKSIFAGFVSVKNLLFLIILIFASFKYFRNDPTWGEWDAWAIWNIKAKFLADETRWESMFSNTTDFIAHLDYPLLLPSILASVWRLIGSYNMYAPMFVSFFIFVFILSVAYYSIENIILSIFFVFILIMDPVFVTQVSYQYADSILALSYMITMILLLGYVHSSKKSYLIVLGFFSSSCLFLKNEGWVFFILILLLVIYYSLGRKGHFLSFIFPCVFFLLMSLAVKFMSPIKSDLFVDTPNIIVGRILNPSRYYMIMKQFSLELFVNFQFALILGLFIIGSGLYKKHLLPFLVLIFTFSGYFMIYLITPHDLNWHLVTSVLRLIHQLYPSFLFLCFMLLETRISGSLDRVIKKI